MSGSIEGFREGPDGGLYVAGRARVGDGRGRVRAKGAGECVVRVDEL